MRHPWLLSTLAMLCSGPWAAADILVRSDGHAFDGKVVSQSDSVVKFEVNSQGQKGVQDFPRQQIRELVTDQEVQATTQAAVPGWAIPPEPSAPPVDASVKGGYYVIPLHGEVGATILATVLEKSLADAG